MERGEFIKLIDNMSDDERRINLPFTLNDEVYPANNFSMKSIFGAAHSGELKNLTEKRDHKNGFCGLI